MAQLPEPSCCHWLWQARSFRPEASLLLAWRPLPWLVSGEEGPHWGIAERTSFMAVFSSSLRFRFIKKLEHTWKALVHDGVSCRLVAKQPGQLAAPLSTLQKSLCNL